MGEGSEAPQALCKAFGFSSAGLLKNWKLLHRRLYIENKGSEMAWDNGRIIGPNRNEGTSSSSSFLLSIITLVQGSMHLAKKRIS